MKPTLKTLAFELRGTPLRVVSTLRRWRVPLQAAEIAMELWPRTQQLDKKAATVRRYVRRLIKHGLVQVAYPPSCGDEPRYKPTPRGLRMPLRSR